MSQTQTCPTCGKSIKAGKSGSLTQWLLTVDSCECNAPSLKLEIDDSVDAPTLCEFCGKLRSDSRQGSLTQWVFGQDRCKCDLDKMYENLDEDLKAAFVSGKNRPPTPRRIEAAEDEAFIDQLESDDFDMHGLTLESFPFLRFRIIDAIGQGNAGIVYECWDMTLRKRIAIKTISSRHYSPEDLMRLQTEARASSKLNHPNVLKVLDFGATTGGQPYMVMELVRGTTLADEIEKLGVIDPRRAVEIFLQVCAAVKHAHESGILHRDIKPSNIMLTRSAEPTSHDQSDREFELAKVIDFGIAAFNKANTFRMEALDEITLVGSPLYMSPDQVNGLIFDERSDIYSIGCVMYESLVGLPPFKGKTAMETMKMHANLELPEFGDNLPEPLVRAVKTALAKSPDDRFQNLDELIDALKVEMQFEPKVEVPIISAPEPDKSWTKKKQVLIGSLVVVGLLFVASAVLVAPRLLSKPKAPNPVKPMILDPLKGKKNDVDRTSKIAQKDSPIQVEENRKANGMLEFIFSGRNRDDSVEEYLKRAAPKQEVSSISILNAKVTARDFELLTKYPNLVDLSFGNASFDEGQLSKLAGCRILGIVAFRGCGITDNGLKQLGMLPQLFSIQLERNPQLTAKGLSYLSKPSLTELSVLASGPFDDAVIEEIATFKKLRNLYIGENGITDKQIDKLTALKNLQLLGLNGSQITNVGFGKLARFTDLQNVYALRCPGITIDGVNRLHAANPDLIINTECYGFMGTDVKKFLGGDGDNDEPSSIIDLQFPN